MAEDRPILEGWYASPKQWRTHGYYGTEIYLRRDNRWYTVGTFNEVSPEDLPEDQYDMWPVRWLQR